MPRYEARYETYSPDEIENAFRQIRHDSRIFSGDEVPFSTAKIARIDAKLAVARRELERGNRPTFSRALSEAFDLSQNNRCNDRSRGCCGD
jgi:hypothetical protein